MNELDHSFAMHGTQTPDLSAELLVHIARLVHGAGSDVSLTPAQWTALRFFARANRLSRTPTAFSEFNATTRGTASQTVKSLVTLGLLERHENELDGRSSLISVTEAGRAKLSADPMEALARAIAALAPDAQAALAVSLGRVASVMARQHAAPTFGQCSDCGHREDDGAASGYCRCAQIALGPADLAALCVDFLPTPRR
ncbi:MAG: helix-turn-helix domain-containing protein [Paracoccaceae bacterium]